MQRKLTLFMILLLGTSTLCVGQSSSFESQSANNGFSVVITDASEESETHYVLDTGKTPYVSSTSEKKGADDSLNPALSLGGNFYAVGEDTIYLQSDD